MKHGKKHGGYTGHQHEIAKAHGHMPDPKPKANASFGTGIFLGNAGHDTMAHGTHHAANAHHGIHDGMSPDGEYGTIKGGSHMGANETHCEGCDSDGASGEMEEGADHSGGESSEG